MFLKTLTSRAGVCPWQIIVLPTEPPLLNKRGFVKIKMAVGCGGDRESDGHNPILNTGALH